MTTGAGCVMQEDDAPISSIEQAAAPACGDGTCNGGEVCDGTSFCKAPSCAPGEVAVCAATCGGYTCQSAGVCGDGTCDPGEDCASCATDCGACPVESIEVFFAQVMDDVTLARSESTISPLEQAIIDDINGATTSIDAAMYSLRRGNLVDALNAADSRGVSVRVVAECENRKGYYKPYFDQLNASIPIVDDNSSYQGQDPNCPDSNGGAMHNKFLIIDRATVWAGSANFTDYGFNYNNNHMVRMVSASVATQFQGEFDQMFAGNFSSSKTGGQLVTHTIAGVTVDIAFSPYKSGNTSINETMLRNAIASASTSIDFAAFHFSNSNVANDLQAKSSITRGIMDATGAASSYSRHGDLCASAIPIKIENFPGKVHHKFGVFDAGTTSAPQVILGSANWTSSGVNYNDETMLRIYDPSIATAVYNEFLAMYDDPANTGLECCNHSAEAFNANSALCGSVPCVCNDSSDNDFDALVDSSDSDCSAAFVCGTSSGTGACEIGPENTAAACGDCFSNDGDAYVDGNDYDCPSGSPMCTGTIWETVSECQAQSAVCGDGYCRSTAEDCSTCEADCGVCGSCAPSGGSCVDNADCCSGLTCGGPPQDRTCR